MKYTLDASAMKDKKSSHDYLREIMNFPDYYGCNLDALYDCLTDIDEAEIHFVNVCEAGEYFGKIKDVFDEAAEYCGKITITSDGLSGQRRKDVWSLLWQELW